MLCCYKRKPNNNFQMLNLQRNAHSETKNLSNIYDLILSPCDNTDLIPETPPKQIITPRKSNIYINFFEENDSECNTPLFDCNMPSTPTTSTPSTPSTSSAPSTPTSINYYTRAITPSIPINYNRRHSTPVSMSLTPPNYSTTPPNYSTTPPNYSTRPLTPQTPRSTSMNYNSRPQTPINYCTTPRMYQDINGNMIHIQIPRNSDLYVNYEKFNI